MKTEMTRQILLKTPNIKFNKNPFHVFPVSSCLRTEAGMPNTNVRFEYVEKMEKREH